MKIKVLSTVFVFFFILSAINSLSGQNNMPQKYQSLLWEITGNGLNKPSYLYGTMHVSNKIAFNLPDSFFVAMNNCEAVALELDMDEWMSDIMMRWDAQLNKNTTTYIKNFSGFYSSAFALDIPKERNLKFLLQFTPHISNNLMYRNNRYNSDYEEDNYLDVFIFQAGKKLNKKVTGLENLVETEKLVKKAGKEENDEEQDEDAEQQKRLRMEELSGDKGYYESIQDAYRKGNLDLIDTLYKLSSGKGFLKYFLYERNKIMVKGMDSIMKTQPLFTGVGAAHLPGQDGVIELLRQKGYTVRPINTDKAGVKAKLEIDETRFPTQFTKQYSPDSAFSVAVPGKLHELSFEGSFRYYLYNDVSNGSYYCIQRMNHYGKLLNQSQEYILKRIDSLIYENVPGKILSKEPLNNKYGYPGYEIMNKTAKGDVQKQWILVTPNEIYSFKMSGTQDYIKKGNEAGQFFSSITFYELDDSNSTYTSNYGYTVSIPSNKSVSETNGNVSRNKTQHEIINASDKHHYMLIMSASLYDFNYIEQDTFELNMLAERFCLEANKRLVSKKHFFYPGLKPAIRFTVKNSDSTGHEQSGQIIISGADYYLMYIDADSSNASPFFSSFKLTPKNYITPFTSITDTSLHFNAKAQEIKNDYSDIIEEEANSYNYLYPKKKKKEEERLFLPIEERKVYISPDTKEAVYVEFRKFSMFFQRKTIDDFWDDELFELSGNESMIVSRKTKTKRDNIYEYSFMLSDTGSSRGIITKLFQKCGTYYTLKTLVDTAEGLTGFAKTFFESFSLEDTCMGIDLTKSKLEEYFFAKLYSSDTLESKQAREAIDYVHNNVLDSHIPALINSINHKEFTKLSTDEKTDLISSFGYVKSKETLPFLETLYQRYADSAEIELSILSALADWNSTEANKMIIKLLKVDVPITNDEYGYNDLFYNFNTEKEATNALFPELLKYTKYPEYKKSVYELMADAIENGILKPYVYRKQVPDILLDANYELKKYMSDEDRDETPTRYSYYGNTMAYNKPYDDLNTTQKNIAHYIFVLAPHYKKNNDVKKFFTKVLSSTESNRFQAFINGELMKEGIMIEDTVLSSYATSVSGRLMLYKILKEQDKLHLFDKKHLNQQDLVISQLYGGEEDFEKDTLVLLNINETNYNGQKGNVYTFKIKEKDKKIWKLGYSAVHPSDNTSLIAYNPKFSKSHIAFDSDTQMKKEIDLLMRQIRIEDHKRASISDFEK